MMNYEIKRELFPFAVFIFHLEHLYISSEVNATGFREEEQKNVWHKAERGEMIENKRGKKELRCHKI